jgi:hypothetical protein
MVIHLAGESSLDERYGWLVNAIRCNGAARLGDHCHGTFDPSSKPSALSTATSRGCTCHIERRNTSRHADEAIGRRGGQRVGDASHDDRRPARCRLMVIIASNAYVLLIDGFE